MKINKTLRELNPCKEGLEYAESFPSFQKAWESCGRPDWMLWVLGRVADPVGAEVRKNVVLIACKCARGVLKHVPAGEERPLKAIEAAEKFATGGDISHEEILAAAYSAARSAYSAASAAHSAAAAARSAASAARSAAYSAARSAASAARSAAYSAASAAARSAASGICNMIREFYPKAPSLKRIGKKYENL